MKKLNLKISAYLILGATIFSSSVFAGNPNQKNAKNRANFELSKKITSKDYMAKTVVVKIDPSKKMDLGKSSINIPELQNVFQKIGATKINKMFPNATTSQSRMPDGSAAPDITTIYKISYSEDISVVDVINELLKNESVVYAEPSYIYHLNYRPNDPDTTSARNYYQKLVKAYEAWDISKGDTNVVIGIIDTGGDLDHPDLAANVKKNYADPVNGVDDDNDGFVDNFLGWDFVGAVSSNFVEDGNPNIAPGGNDHGVHVGGDASAVADNGVGIAGVGFKCKLLFVKCTPDANENAIYTGYEGIVYAADHGASIINCSWGGQGGGGQAGQDVINYAISKGALVVAAAGNDNTDSRDFFPTSFKGVLSVAATSNTDRRASFSNYGYGIDVSAPGVGIYSTVYNNSYASYDGTSMASPVVAGAAAIVKSHFPNYTGLQVGEQLRVTADDINSKNAGGFKDKLGKGRINLLRALTVSSPSIRANKINLIDKNNGAYLPGDTVTVDLEIINYLAATSNLQLTITSTSANVTIIGSTQAIGVLGTLQKTNVGGYKIYIKPTVAENEEVALKFAYTDGTYTDMEFMNVTLNVSSLNIQVNQIGSTATGNGRIGYRNGDATGGLGITYKGVGMLYEASFMVGVSGTKVSNNARGDAGALADEHFVSTQRVHLVNAAGVDHFSAGEFNDANSPNAIGLLVKHRQLAWATQPDDKYIMVEYNIKNNSGVDIPSLYAGMFYDWDIVSAANNKIEWDANLRMGYASSFSSADPWAAVKVLSTTAPPAYYGQSHSVPGDPQEGGFSMAEKYLTLSSGIVNPSYGTTGSGIDAMYTIGAGPYNVPNNQTAKLALAIIAGDNLNDLIASANAAQAKYDNFVATLGINSDKLNGNAFVYPNPSEGNLTIVIPTEANSAVIEITDALGRVVSSTTNDLLTDTYQLNNLNLSNGVYTVAVKTAAGVYVNKVVIN